MKTIIKSTDMIGNTYNYLKVTGIDHIKQPNSVYYMKCECLLCGKKDFVASATHIKFGKTQSCGCYRKKTAADRQTKVEISEYSNIWNKYKSGESCVSIGKEYNVSRQTITAILAKIRKGEVKI